MRLLLIEDDPMIGQATIQSLVDAAHAVDWVTDGPAGLAALRDNRYDMQIGRAHV